MRSSLRFLDIAKTGINSPLRWFKVELFTFLWAFPSLIVVVPIAMIFGKEGGGSRSMFETIKPSALALAVMLLPFLTLLYGLFRQVQRQHGRHWMTIITPNAHINWSKMSIGAAVWGCILLGDIGIGYALEPERFTWVFQLGEWLLTLLVAVTMIPFQAAAEELAFRGYFMQTTALVSKRVWQPLLMTSVLFGMLHYANPEVQSYGWVMMINYIGIGLIWGITALMDDGVELAIGAHAANNILAGLLVTETNSVFQISSLFRVTSQQPSALWLFIDTAVPGAIFLVVVAKVYGWGSWKRLFAPIWDLPEPENAENTVAINTERASE
jgi:membrane protease YdiL (CAAX protease family)